MKSKIYITTPLGELRFPQVDLPHTRFRPEGEFSCGIVLADADHRALEAEMHATFRAAFSERTGPIKLPVYPDKFLHRPYWLVSTRQKPLVIDLDRTPLDRVPQHRDTGCLVLSIRPYADDRGQGVAAYLARVALASQGGTERASRAAAAMT